MNNDPIPKPIPVLSLDSMTRAIGDPTRFRILRVLGVSEPLMVIEIAAKVERPASVTSKHLARLRKAGLVETGRARLYRIPPVFLQTPGMIDYGHCQIPLPKTL